MASQGSRIDELKDQLLTRGDADLTHCVHIGWSVRMGPENIR